MRKFEASKLKIQLRSLLQIPMSGNNVNKRTRISYKNSDFEGF